MKRFNSFKEYETWVDSFDDVSDCEGTAVVIADDWNTDLDMFTECKSYKTAIKRFAKTFQSIDDIGFWAESMIESCESGCFTDHVDYLSYCGDEAFGKYQDKHFGKYAWEVEEVSEGKWYIYLNRSGVYAGHEER